MPEPTSTVSETSSSLDPKPGADDLRLVLFGLPQAGKSSLLGALGQSARAQKHLLGGVLVDESQGLGELAQRLYHENPRQTPGEVVPYPICYEPFAPDGKETTGEKIDAVLMDCDGNAAHVIRGAREAPDEDSPEGTLAHEVADADTLVLVVDGSAPSGQIETDFAEFNRFLKKMQRDRSRRAAVGGLPVFLVLTKCDLLAGPQDDSLAWMERIEQRKRDVDAHFREFLAREEPDKPNAASEAVANPGASEGVKPRSALESPPPEDGELSLSTDEIPKVFGRIDLHVWATAVKRPALVGAPARPWEPYGVAELFRQCLDEAREYRRRCQRSGRRLVGTVLGTGVFVLGMLALAVTLLMVNHTSRAALLQARVEDFRFLDRGGPADRLKGSVAQLRHKESRLEEMRGDPQFSELTPELRDFVVERSDELRAYIPYLEKLIEARPPAAERTEEGLERSTERLKKDLALPQEDWAGTPAGLLVRQRLDAGEALRRAVQAVRNWYLDSADTASKLTTFAGVNTAADIDWDDWAMQGEKLLDPRRKPPFNEADPLPGAPGSLLTYGDAMRFDKVLDARADWESARGRLKRLLQMCSALGLAAAASDRPAVLVFPRNFSLANTRVRLAELKNAYPDYQTIFVRKDLPEVLLPRVRQVVRNQYQTLLVPARTEVLRQLQLAGKGSEETAARWETVRTWLREPEELASWRVLVGVLLQLDDPTAADPVTALASFLGRKVFTIEADRVTLEIPEVRGLRPRAEARLVVLQPASDRQPALAFTPSGTPRVDAARRVRVYTYRLSEGVRLAVRPGERVWAEMPLSGGKEKLVWVDFRSKLYQLESLRNPPRLVSSEAIKYSEGRLIEDVRLVFSPEDGVPHVPDLMPEVKLTE